MATAHGQYQMEQLQWTGVPIPGGKLSLHVLLPSADQPPCHPPPEKAEGVASAPRPASPSWTHLLKMEKSKFQPKHRMTRS